MAGLHEVQECKQVLETSNRELAKATRKATRIENDIHNEENRLTGDAAKDRPIETKLYRLRRRLEEARSDRESWDAANNTRKAALVKAGWVW